MIKNTQKIAAEITATSMDLKSIIDNTQQINEDLKGLSKQIEELNYKKYRLLKESDFQKNIDKLSDELYDMIFKMGEKIISQDKKNLSFGPDTSNKYSYNGGTVAIISKKMPDMNFALLSFSILTSSPQFDIVTKNIKDLNIDATYNIWCRNKGDVKHGLEDQGPLSLSNTINVLRVKIENYIKKGEFKLKG